MKRQPEKNPLSLSAEHTHQSFISAPSGGTKAAISARAPTARAQMVSHGLCCRRTLSMSERAQERGNHPGYSRGQFTCSALGTKQWKTRQAVFPASLGILTCF